MKTEYKYIYFELIENKPKTTAWECRNNKSDDRLGVIQWYPAWRQYCFFPAPVTIFNAGCLVDVQDFLKQMNEAHKNKKEV